ncbi:SDR family oxidoreductase [Streptomyces sp. NPDC001407]|uniref:SDR family oxidoreductase n=1 Tax=Streptomyces sp. NPDC001407 TaxID=3364573 RepID=UPI00367F70E1
MVRIECATVLVTGANRGIGKALVAEFLARGAKRVYAAARNPAAGQGEGRVVPLRVDLTEPGTIAAAARTATDVTLLVNNAGLLGVGHLLDMDLDDVERVMRTNYLGTLRMIRAFVPVLERNEGGAIVNVISVGAFGGTPSLGGYPPSKAALNSLTQAIRHDLAPRSITVHGVFPGPVGTDMFDKVTDYDPAFGEFPPATAGEVARATLDALASGDEDIFPDAFSLQLRAEWERDPRAAERMLHREA